MGLISPDSITKHPMQNIKSKVQGFLSKESNRSLALAGAVTVGVLGIVGVIAASTESVVSTTDSFGNEVLVKCKAKKVRWIDNDNLKGFHTAKSAANYILREGEKQGNPFAALGSAMASNMVTNTIESACSPGVILTNANEKGIRAIKEKEATSVSFSKKGAYKDGITVKVRDANIYTWVESSNSFADRVYPPQGHDMVVVDLTIGNDGDRPSTLSGREFFITDSNGRRYAQEKYNTNFSLWSDETRGESVSDWDSINPGAGLNKTMLFFVPSEAKGIRLADRNVYSFALSK